MGNENLRSSWSMVKICQVKIWGNKIWGREIELKMWEEERGRSRCASRDVGDEVKNLEILTSLWGKPAAEKIGIFWPLAMLFIVSIADMPVWIISSG